MVDSTMVFYTFEDFYKNAKRIKKKYEKLSSYDKCIYRMYVYSNRSLRDSLADKVWEYLNEPFGSAYYVSYEMLGVYL